MYGKTNGKEIGWQVNKMHEQKETLVSIVIPVYNVENYIGRCIESVLGQTYQNFELILVDDGSPDRSGAICDEYALKDERITVIHQENAGVSKARNAGLACAKGEYLLFVDSDDWVENNHIENLLPVGDEDLVYCGTKMYVNAKFVENRAMPALTVTREEWVDDYANFDSRGLTIFFISPCYRMDIIREKNLMFDVGLRISEDGLFNLEYLKYCKKIRYSDVSTYCYEDGDDSSTSLSHSFHPMRMCADMKKCLKIEELTQKKEFMMRWKHWHGIIRHYKKWLHFNGGIRKKEAQSKLRECYQNEYFRECIPYVRKHGSLDERIETFFMRSWLHPLYKPFYSMIIFASKVKNAVKR